eukprot:1159452-Pelagomonas_calceolata.AAC.10
MELGWKVVVPWPPLRASPSWKKGLLPGPCTPSGSSPRGACAGDPAVVPAPAAALSSVAERPMAPHSCGYTTPAAAAAAAAAAAVFDPPGWPNVGGSSTMGGATCMFPRRACGLSTPTCFLALGSRASRCACALCHRRPPQPAAANLENETRGCTDTPGLQQGIWEARHVDARTSLACSSKFGKRDMWVLGPPWPAVANVENET